MNKIRKIAASLAEHIIHFVASHPPMVRRVLELGSPVVGIGLIWYYMPLIAAIACTILWVINEANVFLKTTEMIARWQLDIQVHEGRKPPTN